MSPALQGTMASQTLSVPKATVTPAGTSSSTGVIELCIGPIDSVRAVSIQAVGQQTIMTLASFKRL